MACMFIESIHVYRNITWTSHHSSLISWKQEDFGLAKIETNKESKKVDPYSCAIKAFVGQSPQFKTVGHILREISSHAFFFLKEQNGKFEESVYSAGGLEIPIFLTFKSTCSVTHQKIKTIGPSAPVRFVPVASPVDNFAGTASLV